MNVPLERQSVEELEESLVNFKTWLVESEALQRRFGRVAMVARLAEIDRCAIKRIEAELERRKNDLRQV